MRKVLLSTLSCYRASSKLGVHAGITKIAVAFLLLLAGTINSFASNLTINHGPIVSTLQTSKIVTGIVTDEKGDALVGATISEKGTANGIQSDIQGHFKLTVNSENAVLIIRFIGYVTKELNVYNKTDLTIKLTPDSKTLTDVVVIGYGTQSRKTVSTAISKISGADIEVQPVGNVAEALAASAPGLDIQSDRGGTPGSAPTIRIRGAGSLGTGSTPLYVVDGYPLQSADQFNLINPKDIASVEVLKDAASAAIYGSRAGNGVIIVTTKRGKTGKSVFNVSSYTGAQSIAKKINVLDKDGYINYIKFLNTERGTPANVPTIFNNDPGSLANTDWQDVIFRTAPNRNLQISATGGSDKIKYALTTGYFSQTGVLIGSDFLRLNLHLNLDAELAPKLKLGATIAPSYGSTNVRPAAGQYNSTNSSENNGSRAVGNTVGAALLYAPTVPVYQPNGDYSQTANAQKNNTGGNFYQSNIFNPLATLELYNNRVRNYRFFGSVFLEWEILKDLKIKTSGGVNTSDDQQSAYIPATMATELAPAANLSNPILANIYAREGSSFSYDYLWENTLSYSHSFGFHSLSAVGVFSLQKFRANGTSAQGRVGTFTTTLIENPFASPDRVGDLFYDQNAFMSYVGRIVYDFKKKYIVSGAIRSDESSRFGPNNRTAIFPSGSIAWRVSEEPFFAKVKSTINELKFRASYGLTGNANIGSFNYLNNVISSNYSLNSVRVFGYAQNGFANPDLTWEKNNQLDLGLDAGFLNDKFSLGIDYYDRITEAQLLNRSLPSIVGYATTFRTNIGKLQNRGIELSASANTRIGNLKWVISANISANRSKVLDLGGPNSFPYVSAINGINSVYQVRVGEPLGDMYGFNVLGIFRTTDDLNNYAKVSAGNKIGDWIIEDTNKDGIIDEGDRHKIGNGTPNYLYGLTQNLSYKNFDFTIILQGVQGINEIPGTIRQFYNGLTFNVTREFADDVWNSADPTRETRWPSLIATGYTPNNQLTNRMIYDGSYLRVKNITVGYTVSKKPLLKVGINSIRLYVTGQNIFTFTSYPGYSPDSNVNPGTLTQPGVDQGTYPNVRTIVFGANINF